MTADGTSMGPQPGAGRPLRWRERHELARMEAALRETATAWSQDWTLVAADGAAAVRCVAAHEELGARERDWIFLGRDGDAAAWTEALPRAEWAGWAAVFGIQPDEYAIGWRPAITHEAATQALQALAEALRRALRVQVRGGGQSPGAGDFLPWCGSVVVTIALGGSVVSRSLLNAACASRLAGDRARAAPVRVPAGLVAPLEAVADQPAVLAVELASCELDLGSLQALCPGDLVPLPHGLDDPLRVVFGGATLCHGYLGRRCGAKAIELVALAPA